jgi:hypothetical protein
MKRSLSASTLLCGRLGSVAVDRAGGDCRIAASNSASDGSPRDVCPTPAPTKQPINRGFCLAGQRVHLGELGANTVSLGLQFPQPCSQMHPRRARLAQALFRREAGSLIGDHFAQILGRFAIEIRLSICRGSRM